MNREKEKSTAFKTTRKKLKIGISIYLAIMTINVNDLNFPI
jgi:hypothetical protein